MGRKRPRVEVDEAELAQDEEDGAIEDQVSTSPPDMAQQIVPNPLFAPLKNPQNKLVDNNFISSEYSFQGEEDVPLTSSPKMQSKSVKRNLELDECFGTSSDDEKAKTPSPIKKKLRTKKLRK